MKIKSLSPTLIRAATAITFGVIPWQNPVQAVVELNISEAESNVSRPQLLVKDSQQLAILTENEKNTISSENTTHKFTFADSQKLNKLANLTSQSSPILIANEQIISSETLAVDASHSSSQQTANSPEAIYIPIQSSVEDTDSISIPANTQPPNSLSAFPTNSTANREDNSNMGNNLPSNIVPAETENDNFHSDKPVLISPANQANTLNTEQMISVNDDSATPTKIDLSSNIQRFNDQPREQNSDDSQLMGSVPIGVDYYNPAVTPPMGSMVSPELPYLYPADEYLPDGQKPRTSDGYIWPAKGVLTSGYGWRWGRMHKGIDIAAPVGTPILAVADGKVIKSGWHSGGYGNLVKLKHYDGSITLYAHNSKLFVRRGQEVRQGQHIANMGSTGFSTGPHLHFELHPHGQGAINPMALLPKK